MIRSYFVAYRLEEDYMLCGCQWVGHYFNMKLTKQYCRISECLFRQMRASVSVTTLCDPFYDGLRDRINFYTLKVVDSITHAMFDPLHSNGVQVIPTSLCERTSLCYIYCSESQRLH